VPKARRLHRAFGFDVIHHVTLNAIDLPGFLWVLPPAFYWGPVGGGQLPPRVLRAYYGRAWTGEQLRAIRKRLVLANPIVRRAVRHSACVLVANEDTERILFRMKPKRLLRELEAAIDLPESDSSNSTDPGRDDHAFTIIWAGRLIPRKAPLLAVHVLMELRRRGVDARMTMVGDGPLRAKVMATVQSLQLQDCVSLLGAIPHSQMCNVYAQGDVFLFSSLQDTSGNVILEAMAYALPVVALDHQGAAEIVSVDSGIKIPIIESKQVISDMASALHQLACNPDLRRRMAEAGRRRVFEAFSWSRKGELLRDLYAGRARDRTVAP
jgi:glycosyltransferase involved in cell wall biosynthesis